MRLTTRHGTDATRWYPELQSLAVLGGHHVLDGEACYLDQHGRSDFVRFHERSRRRRRSPGEPSVIFAAFDVLILGGRDVRALPLQDRKEALRELLAAASPRHVLFVDHFPGHVTWLYHQAAALGLEGIVAKRLDSPYRSGERVDFWRKIKPVPLPRKRFTR